MVKDHCAPKGLRLSVTLCLAMAIAQSWMLVRPYDGIIRDALHYTALALYRIDTSTMAKDALFIDGHATYSIFPAIYTPIVAAIGPGPAHLSVVIFGQAIWMIGLIWIAWLLFERRWLVVAGAMSALFLSDTYGPNGAITYLEMQATPRLFGEAATLLAVGAVVAGRIYLAALLCAVALAIHPLMAGPGVLIVLSYRFGLWRGCSLPLLAGAVFASLLAASGLPPFDALFQKFDPVWKSILDELFPNYALSKSSLIDLSLYILPMTSLVLAATSSHRNLHRIARPVLVVSLVFCCLSVLGEATDNVLLVNLHLWRALWLLVLFGNLLAVPVLVLVMRSKVERFLFCLTLVVGAYEPLVAYFPISAATLALLSLLARFVIPAAGNLLKRLIVAFIGLGVAAALIVLGALISARIVQSIETDHVLAFVDRPVLLTAIGVALLLIFVRPTTRGTVGAAFVLVCSALMLPQWDYRDSWRVAADRGQGARPEVAALLQGRTVYWEGGPEIPWLIFRQASYYSCIQSASILANRDSAIRFDDRGQVLRRLNTVDFPRYHSAYCHQRHDPNTSQPVKRDDMRAVCEELGDLNLIALKDPIDGARALNWEDTAPRPFPVQTARKEGQHSADAYDMIQIDGVHLYDCADFRSGSAQSGDKKATPRGKGVLE